MHRSRILLPLVLAAFPACTAGAAHGQTQQRVGNFGVERKADPITDEDKSFAGVVAQGGDQQLALIWHCSGREMVMGFGFQQNGYGAQMGVVWRFDREEPEALTLSRSGESTSLYLLPDDYEHDFTTRIRNASRFVVRVLAASGAVDYVFDLDGSERALGSLGCVRALRPPADPPGILGRAADELLAEQTMPLESRADTLRLFDHYTPASMRGQRGEVAVQAWVTADGRVSWEGLQVTRTAHADFSNPAMFIVSQMTFPPGRARRVTVYVYFSPTGGHIQVEDPG